MVGVNLVWALSYPVSKRIMKDLPALALTSWRLLLGGLVLLPFLRRSELANGVSLYDSALLLGMGVLGCAGATTLQYLGTVHTLAANVALIVGLETLMVVAMAAILLREPLTRRFQAGLGLALAGAMLITVDPSAVDLVSSQYLSGSLLVFASLFCYAGYTIVSKRLAARWSPVALTALPFLVGAAVTIPIFAVADPRAFARSLRLSTTELLGIAFIGVAATALSYATWNWLLRFLPAGRLANSLYLQPVAGALFSSWLLGEKLTPTFFLGAALVLLAMAFAHEPSS